MTTTEFESAAAAVVNAFHPRRVIVALSGGADSVALLLALVRAGSLQCVEAAHCNYGLRGAESDGDEAYVSALCARLGVKLHKLRPDVRGRMRSTGESLEMACRELRYAWFEELRTAEPQSLVAVAHHRRDQAETVLLNLLRGTGLRGLRGMTPYREPGIVRPLLALSRDDVERYLLSLGETWRTDSTNAECDVKRNKLRNKVLPVLRELFAGAEERICATAAMVADDESLFDRLIAEKWRRYERGDSVLAGEMVATEGEEMAGQLLWRCLRGKGLTREMAADVAASPHRPSAIFGPFLLTRGLLTPLDTVSAEAPAVQLASLGDGPWRMDVLGRETFSPRRGEHRVAWLDASVLEGNPRWEWRPLRKGDRMAPYGMGGRTRLLSDMMTELRYSENDKRRARALTRDGVIIWVPGVRASAHFPVTAGSRRVVRLILQEQGASLG